MTTDNKLNSMEVTTQESSSIMKGAIGEDLELIESRKEDSLHDVEGDHHDNNNNNSNNNELENIVSVNRDLRSLLESPSREDGPGQPVVSRRKNFRNLTKIGAIEIQDHFSLQNPSSHISFADDEVVVFVDDLEQITLEKKKDHNFYTAKQATVASPGIILLRWAYTTIAFMLAGFVFVFCLHIILFLFLSLAIASGEFSFRSVETEIRFPLEQ